MKMENGIYRLEVFSAGEGCGGVVVIRENFVNGGGDAYLYLGRLTVEKRLLGGSFTIRKWNEEEPSLLGLFKEVAISVSGEYNPDSGSFRFEGRARGHHAINFEMKGRFLAPLVRP